MAREARHDLARVRGERRDEFGIARRDALDPRARLAELLPDSEPELVAEVVELLGLEQAAAPDADEVRAGARREAKEALDLVRVRDAVQRIHRHPVPALDDLSFPIRHEPVPPVECRA